MLYIYIGLLQSESTGLRNEDENTNKLYHLVEVYLLIDIVYFYLNFN